VATKRKKDTKPSKSGKARKKDAMDNLTPLGKTLRAKGKMKLLPIKLGKKLAKKKKLPKKNLKKMY